MKDGMSNIIGGPAVVNRSTFDTAVDALRTREKAHTREGDAIAAARRGLPMMGETVHALVEPRWCVHVVADDLQVVNGHTAP